MKLLFFYFIVVLSSYSQTSFHGILKSLNGVSETNISESNRASFYLGKDSFDKFTSNKILDLYKDSSTKAEYCIIPISISSEFNIYVQIPSFILKEKKNLVTTNVYGSYLIFDKKDSKLYRIDCESSCGSVYKKNKNVLITNSSFNMLMPSVFILDKDLKNLKKVM
ncbi:hypothetical protein [Flavobacterium tructae]|uniref:Uncharacterized protein n=1 Tax=Flavobacterium tructae TaxID=1114873 RepID=A0A1S1J5X0_9FLAO|nr:hypothetical protein [Flavobacterium tructae]OHT45001.1 hypothetical protein BHE19_09820 [Flavobacterium tructae]OXB16647.1 hypothetical protein B0A71_19480 [Flavobacterium tructae]OXB20637.1 hypothetical protein B0A80_18585 [Flavobacterium tructae]